MRPEEDLISGGSKSRAATERIQTAVDPSNQKTMTQTNTKTNTKHQRPEEGLISSSDSVLRAGRVYIEEDPC